MEEDIASMCCFMYAIASDISNNYLKKNSHLPTPAKNSLNFLSKILNSCPVGLAGGRKYCHHIPALESMIHYNIGKIVHCYSVINSVNTTLIAYY